MDDALTERDPVSAADPADLITVNPRISEAAAQEVETWRELRRSLPLTSQDTAADLLGISHGALFEHVRAGRVNALVVDGEVWIAPAQLYLQKAEAVHRGRRDYIELRTQATTALRAFLHNHAVTGSWETAVTAMRPLVCARRGKSRSNYGLDFHSVVLRASWLVHFALQRRETLPELASLPTGPELHRALVSIPGVRNVSYAKPLFDDGVRTHKLDGWVRIEPSEWQLLVPEDVEAAVGPPEHLQ